MCISGSGLLYIMVVPVAFVCIEQIQENIAELAAGELASKVATATAERDTAAAACDAAAAGKLWMTGLLWSLLVYTAQSLNQGQAQLGLFPF